MKVWQIFIIFCGHETWKNCEGKKISWANNAVLKGRRETYLRKNAAAERGRKDPRWEKRYSRTAMDGWMVRRPRISGRTLFPGEEKTLFGVRYCRKKGRKDSQSGVRYSTADEKTLHKISNPEVKNYENFGQLSNFLLLTFFISSLFEISSSTIL